MKNYLYNVSVILITYNSDLKKIRNTILSIVNQKGIIYEIIVADDGSKIFYSAEIANLFKSLNFRDYKIVQNSQNVGTIKNIYSGLLQCNGEIIKLISPGDLLISEYTLFHWISAFKKTGKNWSFGDVVYYKFVNNEPYCFSSVAHPQILKHYIKQNDFECRWNYFVLADIAIGAAILCKSEVMKKYLQIVSGRIKYAEDNIYRIMMYEGETAFYYPKDVILYEYGEGISTSRNEKWQKILSNEWKTVDKIICFERLLSDKFQRKMVKAVKRKYSKNILDKFVSKINIRVLFLHFKKKLFPRKTHIIEKENFKNINLYEN